MLRTDKLGSGRTTAMIRSLPADRNVLVFCLNTPQKEYIRYMILQILNPTVLANIKIFAVDDFKQGMLRGLGYRRSDIFIDHAVFEVEEKQKKQSVTYIMQEIALLRD